MPGCRPKREPRGLVRMRLHVCLSCAGVAWLHAYGCTATWIAADTGGLPSLQLVLQIRFVSAAAAYLQRIP
jgi:hypothetical protein